MADPTSHDQQSKPEETKTKRKLKRTLASCSGCRRRRTRCDRLLPCSECDRRGLPCDYEGASAPSLLARRHLTNLDEREQYIQHLEARLKALEDSKKSPTHPPIESPPAAKIDFIGDDLAYALSSITLGPRAQLAKHHHPLESQLEAILASLPHRPTPAVFLAQDTFKMSLIPTGPAVPLDRLQASLPPPSELFELASYYFETLNIWVAAIEPSSWPDTVLRCYEPLDSNPESIHRLVAVFTVAAHGLLRKADVHHLQPSASTSPQHQQIALAHQWFHLALNALIQPDQGAMLTRPSIWGIRAMTLLANVELSPENFDNLIFFSSLTSNLAGSVGLFHEPPGFDTDTVSPVEVESRRQLAWTILGLDWVGATIAGGTRQPIDADYYAVKIPGTVDCELDHDGWPKDPVVAMRRACALSDMQMCRQSSVLLSGRLASYDEVLNLECSLMEVETMVPDRLQVVISSDGRSIKPKVPSDAYTTMTCFAVWKRFSVGRVRLHRPFIFPKEGVSDTERTRHLLELEKACRTHLLISEYFPHSYMMHPLVIFMYVNTGVACALALVTCPNLFDASFFLPELKKLIEIFVLAQKTIASNLARKAVMLLETLMKRAQDQIQPSTQEPAPKRRPGPSPHANPLPKTHDADQLKHKLTKQSSSRSYEQASGSFESSPPQLSMSNIRQIVPLPLLPPPRPPMQTQHRPVVGKSGSVSTLPTSSPPLIDLSAMSSIPFSFRPPNTGTSSSFSEVEDQYRLTPPEEPIFDPHFLNFFGLVAPPLPPTTHSDSHHHQHHHHHQQPEASWTGDPFRPVFNGNLNSGWNPDAKDGKAMGDGHGKTREEWTWER